MNPARSLPPHSAAAALAAGFLVCAAAGTAAGIDTDPCQASLALEPERGFVGQQILYRLRVLRRADVRSVDWAVAPSFPAFRAEALPTRTAASSDPEEGPQTFAFEERRALFPVRAGELAIPGAALRCFAGTDAAAFVARVPATRIEILALPEEGRPPDFAGVVGRVRVRARAEPPQVGLGEAARVSVVVEGEANLWRLPPPFPADALPPEQAELLAQPPELARDAGRRLRLRRHFVYHLVPRRAGSLRLPGIRVPYFDPATARYAVAQAAPLVLQVQSAAPAAGDAQPPASPGEMAPTRGEPWGSRWLGLAAGSLALALLLLLLRRRRPRQSWRAVQAALGEAEACSRAGDPTRAANALARAVRLALEDRVPGARARSAEELPGEHPDPLVRESVALLADLDRTRFAGDASGQPDGAQVARLLERLRQKPLP